MTRSDARTDRPSRPSITVLDAVRAIILLAALASFAIWGFAQGSFPLTLVFGIGVPLIALLVWALILSPRPVLRVHPFVRAIVELLIYAAVTMCWWDLGEIWIGLAFAVVAITAGLFAGLRTLR